jgi:hypothetical protein
MIPINNSDTAWLVVTDYNQDNGKFYEQLREDILNCNVNEWDWDYKFYEPFTIGLKEVGAAWNFGDKVGNGQGGYVGEEGGVGEVIIDIGVGGNPRRIRSCLASD